MSKVAVVFWSGTGNTEAMADLVAEGVRDASAEVDVIQAADFSADKLDGYDAVAFGCPAMGSENLEEDEFEPMFAGLEDQLSGRKVALFGSYAWAEGEWMETWKERTEGDGAEVAGTVISYEDPDDEAAQACKELGASLA